MNGCQKPAGRKTEVIHVRAILFALVVCVVGCQKQQAAARFPGPADTNEMAVVVSYLEQHYDYCIKSNTPLVIEDTFSIAMLLAGDESQEAFTKSLLSAASEEVPIDLIRDFCAKNSHSEKVWPELRARLPVVLLRGSELDSFFAVDHNEKPDGWDRFYAKYPKSPGIITISRVGFNSRGDLAMFYIGSQRHWLAGSGSIHVMRRQGNQWVEEPVSIGRLWVS